MKKEWKLREETADRELFARRMQALPSPEVPDLEDILLQVDAAEARPAAHHATARWVDRVQVWGPATVMAAWFACTIAPRGELHRDARFQEEGSSLPKFVSPPPGHAEVCSADEDLGLPVCALPVVSDAPVAQAPAMTMVSQEDPLDSSGCARETSCLLPR